MFTKRRARAGERKESLFHISAMKDEERSGYIEQLTNCWFHSEYRGSLAAASVPPILKQTSIQLSKKQAGESGRCGIEKVERSKVEFVDVKFVARIMNISDVLDRADTIPTTPSTSISTP